MSKNALVIFNRLLTASMLVVSLIACQHMPDNSDNLNFHQDLHLNLNRAR